MSRALAKKVIRGVGSYQWHQLANDLLVTTQAAPLGASVCSGITHNQHVLSISAGARVR